MWSPQQAAGYLDERGDYWLKWTSAARGQGTACVSCHTALPFALARPALGKLLGESAASDAERRQLAGVTKRVRNWDAIVAGNAKGDDPFRPFYAGEKKPSALGTEAILNAMVLVAADARQPNPALSETMRQALGHLWSQQTANGNWPWLDFGLRPWESDGSYYGASLAALAVGTVGAEYYEGPAVRPKVAALKGYLRTQFPNESLHHRAVAVWASDKLPDTLPADAKAQVERELLSVQEADGSWSVAKLGKPGIGAWKSHGVYPAESVGDGYATGLAVLALRRAGIRADDARLQRGVAWLSSHQHDGTWPVNYVNKPRDPQENVGKFMRDAATGFAVLALTDN